MIALLLLACTGTGPGPGGGTFTGTDTGTGTWDTAPSLPDAMDQAALLSHLDALQAIADANDGTRLAGLPGYDASAEYAASVLEDAGYTTTWQEFQHAVFIELSPPVLAVDSVDGDESEAIATMEYSPSGSVTGPLAAVDLFLPPGSENSSTSGCEADDYDGFAAGSIALIQRGTCTYEEKVANAEAAGAIAAVVFNEGQDDRQDTLIATLGQGTSVSIPALGASFALGDALATALQGGTVQATVTVDVLSDERAVWNVIADAPGTGEGIVVVGAHLDSVAAGPGINDNGSGSATVLELARQHAALGLQPEHTVRFALWGAEESGLIGSFEYVDQLSESELGEHVGNLNYDMVASPNGARFVYDGDESANLGGYPPPSGSDDIEDLHTDWFDDQAQAWDATAFSGRSDYGPFIYVGIPAGGLFSGAEGEKSDSQADSFGGTAGQALDPCYHQACDTTDNLDAQLLIDMARAAAAATQGLSAGGLLEPVGLSRNTPQLPLPEHHAVGGHSCSGDVRTAR